MRIIIKRSYLEEAAINRLKLRLTQNQFDALVRFTYNIGIGSFVKSTLLADIKGEALKKNSC